MTSLVDIYIVNVRTYTGQTTARHRNRNNMVIRVCRVTREPTPLSRNLTQQRPSTTAWGYASRRSALIPRIQRLAAYAVEIRSIDHEEPLPVAALQILSAWEEERHGVAQLVREHPEMIVSVINALSARNKVLCPAETELLHAMFTGLGVCEQ